jgi:hypothetical protein
MSRYHISSISSIELLPDGNVLRKITIPTLGNSLSDDKTISLYKILYSPTFNPGDLVEIIVDHTWPMNSGYR